MKKILILFTLMVTGTSFAQMRWGYCVAYTEDIRYCTIPTAEIGHIDAKCLAFAKKYGADTYDIKLSSDPGKLKEAMGIFCDIYE